MIGHVLGTKVYSYKGFVFEDHRYLGPIRLKKNGEPSKQQGKTFYDMYAEFAKLTDEEKRKYYVSGGSFFF